MANLCCFAAQETAHASKRPSKNGSVAVQVISNSDQVPCLKLMGFRGSKQGSWGMDLGQTSTLILWRRALGLGHRSLSERSSCPCTPQAPFYRQGSTIPYDSILMFYVLPHNASQPCQAIKTSLHCAPPATSGWSGAFNV